MRKSLVSAFIALTLAPSTCLSQACYGAVPLFWNGTAINQGKNLSIVSPPNGTLGYSADFTQGNWIADDFSVWPFPCANVLTFFAYQQGASGPPVKTVHWQLRKGDELSSAVTILEGEDQPDWQYQIGYRVESSEPNNQNRPIYGVEVVTEVWNPLPNEKYWLMWSLTAVQPGDIFVPQAMNGNVQPPAGNAHAWSVANGFTPLTWGGSTANSADVPFQVAFFVPEPATISALTLGLLFSSRKKRKTRNLEVFRGSK